MSPFPHTHPLSLTHNLHLAPIQSPLISRKLKQLPKHISTKATMSTPYPTAYQIEEMFSSRAGQSTFNSYCADNIEITIVGKGFNVGGYCRSAQHFDEDCFNRIMAALRQETVRVEVLRVIGGGESAWAAVKSFMTATSRYGE